MNIGEKHNMAILHKIRFGKCRKCSNSVNVSGNSLSGQKSLSSESLASVTEFS